MEQLHALLFDPDGPRRAESPPALAGLGPDRLLLSRVASWDEARRDLHRGSHDALLVVAPAAREPLRAFLAEGGGGAGRVPVVVLARRPDPEVERETLRLGAADYLELDGLDGGLLDRAIRHAVERTRAASNLQLLQRIATAANEAADADAALQAAVEAVCVHTRWPVGVMLRRTPEGHLESPGGLRVDEGVPGRLAWFDAPERLSPGVGLAGRVCELGEPLFVADVARDRVFHHTPLTRRLGVRSALAFPVKLGRRVEAVLEFFCREPMAAPPAMLEVLGQIGTQLGRALEREAAQAAYRRQEARLERIVGTVTDGVVVLDRRGRVTFANPAAEALLGLARDADGWTAPERALAAIPFGEVLARGEPVRHVERAVRRPDGSEPIVAVSAAPLADEDGGAGVVASLRDVTEAKRAALAHEALEAQLRQSQKMEAVGRLAGGVAHDFNNLLTTITGLTDLLLPGMPDDDPRRGDVEAIQTAALRGAGLTRQLLAFSRRQVLQPRVLDLRGLLADLEKMLRRMIGEDIELLAEARGPGRVKADPGQMEQVVLNLAINARDAMPAGGRLSLSVAEVDVPAWQAQRAGGAPGHYVRLTVEDTGLGMDDETRARIFEPFFTTKDKGKGTGLGLSTVYGIVTQSGGFVEVESRPAQGSRFCVYLPRADEPVAAVHPPRRRRRPVRTGSETVLLVEDETALRHMAQRALEQAGYTVLAAREAAEALSVAGRHDGPIHLLVTDVVLPWMSGQELAEALCASVPGLRVLYMSGYSADTISQHGVLREGVHFLEKPFRVETLLARVRGVLDRPEEAPPAPRLATA